MLLYNCLTAHECTKYAWKHVFFQFLPEEEGTILRLFQTSAWVLEKLLWWHRIDVFSSWILYLKIKTEGRRLLPHERTTFYRTIHDVLTRLGNYYGVEKETLYFLDWLTSHSLDLLTSDDWRRGPFIWINPYAC